MSNSLSLVTQRLHIMPPHTQFANSIFSELTEEIATYLSFSPPSHINDTLNFIKDSHEKIKKGEDIPVIAINRFTNEFIGCSGIHKIPTGYPQLGIWIKKSAQKKGYGKEILSELITYIKTNIPHEYITYPVAKENIASRKLIESLGGIISREKMYTSPTGKILDEVEYRVYTKSNFPS